MSGCIRLGVLSWEAGKGRLGKGMKPVCGRHERRDACISSTAGLMESASSESRRGVLASRHDEERSILASSH